MALTSEPIRVEVVSAEGRIWEGDATQVITRTTEGDIGILPGHTPILSSIIEGVVDVQTVEGETWIAAVDAGFLSVADNRVSILAERAEMSHEIDLEKARRELARAKEMGEDNVDAEAAVRSAEARIRAAEQAS